MVYTLQKWQWDVNYQEPVMRYNFNTIVYRNRRFYEQRRPLLPQPVRKESVEFLEERLAQQKLFHDLRKSSLAVLAVPVFPELIRPTADLQGLTTLPVKEDLDEFWNTQIAEVVWLKSITQDLSELKRVSAVNSDSIEVTAAVVADFTIKDTLIYPCFVGILASKTVTGETSRIFTVKAEFKEVFVDWEL